MNHSTKFLAINLLASLSLLGCSQADSQEDLDLEPKKTDSVETTSNAATDFLEAHEVDTELTRLYCRTDVATPDCRVLLRYRNIESGDLVNSFRMTFSNPVSQQGGTELFLAGSDESDAFSRWTDETVNAEVEFEEKDALPVDVQEDGSVIVEGLQFGSLRADLVFDDTEAFLIGEITQEDGSTKHFDRIYPRHLSL